MIFDNLADYVRTNFDGILVVGDVHADIAAFTRAHNFAKSESFFFISLGDLVDHGKHPYETVHAMSEIILDGRGALVVGNHDDKFYRYAHGNKVKFSDIAKQTLVDVGSEREESFLNLYTNMINDTTFSKIIHSFDNISLMHAACHRTYWENRESISKSMKSMALVGEVNGELHDNGMPVRLYNWVDDIPAGKTVVVGHDRSPVHNITIVEPLIVTGKSGGIAVFMDTGSSKGGFLSGVVIVPDKNNNKTFKIDSYVNFKE